MTSTLSLCQQECSTDVTALESPIALPDYALHIDFTRVVDVGTCADQQVPAGSQRFVSDVTLHHRQTNDILTSLTIVKNAVVLSEGQIRTMNNDVIEMFHCVHIQNDVFTPLDDLDLLHLAKCRDEVFSIADNWSLNYYHSAVDEMTRLAPFVPFLKQRPDIVIHIGPNRNIRPIMVRYRKLFGLNHDFTWGVVKARVIYKPQTNLCFSPTLTNLQLTNAYAHNYIRHSLERDASWQPIILLLRRRYRRLVNEQQVLAALYELGRHTDRQVVVFDELASPSFNTTLELFYRADVIVGAHGAAMANVLFSRPGTTLIEIHCKGRQTHLCFRMMALRLGLRYFASETTAEHVTWRCMQSGIHVDIDELSTVLRTVAGYLPKL